MSKKNKLLKNTFIIAIGNICTKCITFFLLPLYTSILSTEEYGNVDLISTYTSLLIIILTLQFEQGVFRFLIDSRGDTEKQNKNISTVIFSILAVNIIFVILFLPILKFIKYEYTSYLILISVIGSFMTVVLQIPRGLGDNTTYAIASCINGSTQVVLNVFFIAVLKIRCKRFINSYYTFNAYYLNFFKPKIENLSKYKYPIF